MNEKSIEQNNVTSNKNIKYSLNDLLLKEDEFIELKYSLEDLNNELDRKKFQLKYGKKFTLFFLVPFLIPIMSYLTGNLVYETLYLNISSFMLLESLFVGLKITFFGKKSNVIERINSLTLNINELENNIKSLEKEITVIEDNLKYKEFFDSFKYNINTKTNDNNKKNIKVKTLKK